MTSKSARKDPTFGVTWWMFPQVWLVFITSFFAGVFFVGLMHRFDETGDVLGAILGARYTEHRAIQEEFADLMDELHGATSNNDALAASVAVLSEKISASQQQLAAVDQEISQLRSQNGALSSSNSELIDSIEYSKKLNQDRLVQIQSLRSQTERMVGEKVQLESQLAETKSTVASLNSSKQQLESQIERLEAELSMTKAETFRPSRRSIELADAGGGVPKRTLRAGEVGYMCMQNLAGHTVEYTLDFVDRQDRYSIQPGVVRFISLSPQGYSALLRISWGGWYRLAGDLNLWFGQAGSVSHSNCQYAPHIFSYDQSGVLRLN